MPVTDTTKIGEQPPNTNRNRKSGKEMIKAPTFLKNMFESPRNHGDYVNIGPKHEDAEIYKYMVELAVNLNKKHRGVKGMVSKLTTYIVKTFKRLEDIF